MSLTDKAFLNLITINNLDIDDMKDNTNKTYFMIENDSIKLIDESSKDIDYIPSYQEIKHILYFTYTHVINCIRYTNEQKYLQKYTQRELIRMMTYMLDVMNEINIDSMSQEETEDYKLMSTYFNDLFEILYVIYDPDNLFNKMYYFIEYLITKSRSIYAFSRKSYNDFYHQDEIYKSPDEEVDKDTTCEKDANDDTKDDDKDDTSDDDHKDDTTDGTDDATDDDNNEDIIQETVKDDKKQK